jgi:hypothetical protein
MDVSTTRSPLIPRTLSRGLTTASGSESGPILHVPDWWCKLVDTSPMAHLQYASDINGLCSQPGNGIGNSLDPYFWNARVLLTAIACENRCDKFGTKIKWIATFNQVNLLLIHNYQTIEI